MNRETIIQMAREAGFEFDETDGYWASFTHEIEALVAKAVVKESESRKAAQAENADLKERLARSGIDLRRAVAKERDECAEVCEEMANPSNVEFSGIGGLECAAAIRARGEAV